MTAQRITFASSKGGSGKTTICASVASLLADIGKSVLLIDCDEATHGMTLLYLDRVNNYRKNNNVNSWGVFDNHFPKTEEDMERFDLDLERILNNEPNKKIPKDQPFGYIEIQNNIYFVPATFHFNRKIQSEPSTFSTRLLNIIHQAKDHFDFILIDAQAGTDTASATAISRQICDEVIIVSEFDPLSTAGVERMKALFPDDLAFERTKILLNKLLPEFIENFTAFLSVARYLPPLPWTADVVRAYAKRKLPTNFERGNEYTAALIQTSKDILSENDSIALDEWLSNKANIIKEPILERLDKEKSLFKQYQDEIQSSGAKRRKRKIIESMTITLTFASLAALSISIFRPSFIDYIYDLYKENANDITSQFIVLFSVAIPVLLLSLMKYYFEKIEMFTDDKSILNLTESQLKATARKIEELEFLAKANNEEILKGKRNI